MTRRPRLPGTVALAGLAAAVIVLASLAAPLLGLPDPGRRNLIDSLLPPGPAAHPLGTDLQGRDVLSRVLWGARASFTVSVAVTALAGSIGTVVGLLAGYVSAAEAVAMRVADVQLAFPSIMLAVALAAAIHQTSMITVVVVLVIAGWVPYARVARGITLSVREQLFVEAARSIGAGANRILRRHLLPNLIAPMAALAAVQFGQVMIQEASLSYLGLGIPPAVPSWGGMLQEGQQNIFAAWWPALFPGLAVSLTVLAVTILGDAAAARLSGNARPGGA